MLFFYKNITYTVKIPGGTKILQAQKVLFLLFFFRRRNILRQPELNNNGQYIKKI